MYFGEICCFILIFLILQKRALVFGLQIEINFFNALGVLTGAHNDHYIVAIYCTYDESGFVKMAECQWLPLVGLG